VAIGGYRGPGIGTLYKWEKQGLNCCQELNMIVN
jgi:hypothetical protein